MGMDIHIIGEMDRDSKFVSMKAIADNCRRAGIDIPDEVFEYFGGDPDSVNGPRVDLGPAVEGDAMIDEAVVHLDKLPESVKRIVIKPSI